MRLVTEQLTIKELASTVMETYVSLLGSFAGIQQRLHRTCSTTRSIHSLTCSAWGVTLMNRHRTIGFKTCVCSASGRNRRSMRCGHWAQSLSGAGGAASPAHRAAPPAQGRGWAVLQQARSGAASPICCKLGPAAPPCYRYRPERRRPATGAGRSGGCGTALL